MRFMRPILALLLLWIASPAWGQSNMAMWCLSGTSSTGAYAFLPCSVSNPLFVSATLVPSGTQNVNLTQILGAAPSLTNPLWVFPATGATFPISGTITANIGTDPTQAPVAPATATATKSTLVGAQATTGAVNPTNGQQTALSVDSNNNLLTSAGGAPNLATAQVSVTTGNITAAAARALRRAITITNVTGTGAVYCGNTGVSTSTGHYLGATAGSSITLNTTAAIFCTVASVTQTVTVAETY